MTDTRNNGLTPGYWKTHTEDWNDKFPGPGDYQYAGITITPDASFESLFGIQSNFKNEGTGGDLSFSEALNGGGGGQDALARHAAAAFLNASTDGDNYLLWQQEIIDAVQLVYSGGAYDSIRGERLKNILEYFNELQGASLNTALNDPNDPFGLVGLVNDPNWQATIDPWIL